MEDLQRIFALTGSYAHPGTGAQPGVTPLIIPGERLFQPEDFKVPYFSAEGLCLLKRPCLVSIDHQSDLISDGKTDRPHPAHVLRKIPFPDLHFYGPETALDITRSLFDELLRRVGQPPTAAVDR